jgi:hypothetical protein
MDLIIFIQSIPQQKNTKINHHKFNQIKHIIPFSVPIYQIIISYLNIILIFFHILLKLIILIIIAIKLIFNYNPLLQYYVQMKHFKI